MDLDSDAEDASNIDRVNNDDAADSINNNANENGAAEENNVNRETLRERIGVELARIELDGPTLINQAGELVIPGSAEDPVMLGSVEEPARDLLARETGLRLDWGEYYVPDEYIESDTEDFSVEEAEEASDDALDAEERESVNRALYASCKRWKDAKAISLCNLKNEADHPSTPSFMDLPDPILEKILQYATKQAYYVCTFELVCKRIRKLTLTDDFWTRLPAFQNRTYKFGRVSVSTDRNASIEWEHQKSTRMSVFALEAIHQANKYQVRSTNILLDVLRETTNTGAADAFRTISSSLMSRMIHAGEAVRCIVRGDTIGYLCELLEDHITCKLQDALRFTCHRNQYEVSDADVAFALRGLRSPFEYEGKQQCSLVRACHCIRANMPSSSCGISSCSDIVWRWPIDNCHDVLPPAFGRKIIRRLAYRAGILEMSSEAFLLIEAELLHTLGVLLVDAYESSVEIAKRPTVLLKEGEVLSYNQPSAYGGYDIFETPPPSFRDNSEEHETIYTIVPGQIKAAAQERGMHRYNIYGDATTFWVPSFGFTVEEEIEIAESSYFECHSSDEMSNLSEDVGMIEIDETSDADKNTNDEKSCHDSDESWANIDSVECESEVLEFDESL